MYFALQKPVLVGCLVFEIEQWQTLNMSNKLNATLIST
jgi:hypothetical protein